MTTQPSPRPCTSCSQMRRSGTSCGMETRSSCSYSAWGSWTSRGRLQRRLGGTLRMVPASRCPCGARPCGSASSPRRKQRPRPSCSRLNRRRAARRQRWSLPQALAVGGRRSPRWVSPAQALPRLTSARAPMRRPMLDLGPTRPFRLLPWGAQVGRGTASSAPCAAQPVTSTTRWRSMCGLQGCPLPCRAPPTPYCLC